jgi:hypothetical protein
MRGKQNESTLNPIAKFHDRRILFWWEPFPNFQHGPDQPLQGRNYLQNIA